MGSTTSTPRRESAEKIQEVTQKAEEENQRKMSMDSRKISEDEEKKKQEMEKELSEESAKKKAEKEAELKKIREEELDKANEKVFEFNEMKKELAKRVLELEEEERKNIQKQVEARKKERLEEVKEQNDKLKEERNELILKKKFLVAETEKLTETREKGKQVRSDILKTLEAEENEKLKKHHENLVKLNEEANNVVKEGEEKKTQVIVDQRIAQNILMVQQKEQEMVAVTHSHQLLGALDQEQKFEDFRRNSKNLISLYSTFKFYFDNEETYLNSTRDNIEDGKTLRNPPEFYDALRALQEFMARVESFSLDGCREEPKFTELRKTVKSLLEQLKTIIIEIESRINGYKGSEPTCSFNDESSTQHSDIESLSDSLLSSLDESASLKKYGPVLEKRGNFSIVEWQRKARELIVKLNDEMDQFNIPACNDFDETLKKHHLQLTDSHAHTIAQITNGPSTSSKIAQITSSSSLGSKSIENGTGTLKPEETEKSGSKADSKEDPAKKQDPIHF